MDVTDTKPLEKCCSRCKNIKNVWPENGYILLENITQFYVLDQLNYIYESTSFCKKNV